MSRSFVQDSDQMGMRLQRDSDNLISMGEVCKTFMKNNIDYDLGKDLFYAVVVMLHWPCFIGLNETHIFYSLYLS